MPLYCYICEHCERKAERLHSASERLSLACPECGTTPMTWQFPCPAVHTDSTFMANRDDGFGHDELGRKQAYAKARAAGVSTAGKFYAPGLARKGHRGDPQAWIGSKDDVKRICRQQGLGCEGPGLTVAPSLYMNEPTEPKPYRVAEDIVQREVQQTIEKEQLGKLPRKHRQKLTEETRERLSPEGKHNELSD